MRSFFSRQEVLKYGIYGGLGASFGYWLQGAEENQMRYLSETRNRLLEKRRRRAEREGTAVAGGANEYQKEQEGLFAGAPAKATVE